MTATERRQANSAAEERILLSIGDWLEWGELQSILKQEMLKVDPDYVGQPGYKEVQALYEHQKFLALRPGVISREFSVEFQTSTIPTVVHFRVGDILEQHGTCGLKHLRDGVELDPGMVITVGSLKSPRFSWWS